MLQEFMTGIVVPILTLQQLSLSKADMPPWLAVLFLICWIGIALMAGYVALKKSGWI